MLLLTIYLLNLWIGFQGKQAPAFIPSLCLPAIPWLSSLHNHLWLILLVLNRFHEKLEVCHYSKLQFLQKSRVEERMPCFWDCLKLRETLFLPGFGTTLWTGLQPSPMSQTLLQANLQVSWRHSLLGTLWGNARMGQGMMRHQWCGGFEGW